MIITVSTAILLFGSYFLAHDIDTYRKPRTDLRHLFAALSVSSLNVIDVQKAFALIPSLDVHPPLIDLPRPLPVVAREQYYFAGLLA